MHLQRAIELCHASPGAARTAGIELPGLYVRAIDALEISGDGVRAGAVAEDAYRRFADHPDRATAAVIHQRAAYFRAIDAPAAGLPLIKESLRLFEQTPPSAGHAKAWSDYANYVRVQRSGPFAGKPHCLQPRLGDRRSGRRHGHDSSLAGASRIPRVHSRPGRRGVRHP